MTKIRINKSEDLDESDKDRLWWLFLEHGVTFELIDGHRTMRKLHYGEVYNLITKIVENEHKERIIQLIIDCKTVSKANQTATEFFNSVNEELIPNWFNSTNAELICLGFTVDIRFMPEINELYMIFNKNYLYPEY